MVNEKLAGTAIPYGPVNISDYISTIRNQIQLQKKYDSFIIIGDLLAEGNDYNRGTNIKECIYEVIADLIALGVDSNSCFFIQSQIPELYEITNHLSTFININHIKRMPNMKHNIIKQGLEQLNCNMIFKEIAYVSSLISLNANLFITDIEEQKYIEFVRKLVLKLNALIGSNYFIAPTSKVSKCPFVEGVDGKSRMKNYLNNAIYFKDSKEELKRKIMKLPTDKNRINSITPGNPQNSLVFKYHRIYNKNVDEVKEMEIAYMEGRIMDVEVKERLYNVLWEWIEPIQEKRKELLADKSYMNDIINSGNTKVQKIVQCSLYEIKRGLNIIYEF